MPRPLRIEYPGAAYHVMARGNQGRPIFEDDKDRQLFLETLGEACDKTGWSERVVPRNQGNAGLMAAKLVLKFLKELKSVLEPTSEKQW